MKIKLPLFKLADNSIINLTHITKISSLTYDWSSEYGYHSHYSRFYCHVTLKSGTELECDMSPRIGVSSGEEYDKVDKLNKLSKSTATAVYNRFIENWSKTIEKI